MPRIHRPAVLPILMAMAYVLLVISLVLVRFGGLERAADQSLGLYFADSGGSGEPGEGLGPVVGIVVDGGPASAAGVRPGDRLSRVDGREILSWVDYDAAAERFERGRTYHLELIRDGAPLSLPVVAGAPIPWLSFGTSVSVIFVCLCLGLLALYRRGDDLRARLIAAFSFLLAVELALPAGLLDDPRLDVLGYSLFLLITGMQMAVELHLAVILPERQPWVRRRPWVPVLFYGIGLGWGAIAWWTFLGESSVHPLLTRSTAWMPWSFIQTEDLLYQVLMPIWALAVPSFLAISAFRHREPRMRAQAGLILMGVLPWTAYIFWGVGAELLGSTLPLWVDSLFPLIVLCFPIAVLTAVYRYHLFDIELVVRRSFLYGALMFSVTIAFYISAGALGLLFSKAGGNAAFSIWTVSGAMFLVGLTFNFFRRETERRVDQWLFPEHQALRQRLVHLAGELPAQGNVTAMGQHLVRRLADIFDVNNSSLLLSDPKSGLFFTVASSFEESESERFALSFLVKPDDPALTRLQELGEPVPAGSLLEHSPVLSQRLKSLDAQLLVPLLTHQAMVGVMVLGRRQGHLRFSAEDRELLSLIGHQIATAFENIRLFESATFESLTGLRRREAILDLLRTEIDRARRYRRPLVVGMADLDFFKAVNDRYGHLAGDAVLKRVAEELTSGLRSADAVGRYGGEEFLLVLPETGLEGGAAVADKLRRQVGKLSLPMDDGSRVEPRISIGLAQLGDLDLGSRTLLQLIENADKALYRAKAAGRNRVEIFVEETDEADRDEDPSGSDVGLRA